MMGMERAIAEAAGLVENNDRDFFERVWATSPDVYRARLRAVGFDGLGHVLDAGSGSGQWSNALVSLGSRVTALDVSVARLEASRLVARSVDAAGGAGYVQGSVEKLPFADGSFDGVFCYSVIMMTDYRLTLSEFARVLRPGGRLYVCGNGLGWYVFNLIEEHNRSPRYDPRRMAIETLDSTIDYFALGTPQRGRQVVVPSRVMVDYLESLGFTDLQAGAEGTLTVDEAVPGRSFYPPGYYNLEGVYELVGVAG